MKLEFKKIKEMEGHEGIAYHADLYVDGKRVGTLYNDGNGGDYDFSRNSKYNGPVTENKLNNFVKSEAFTSKELTEDPKFMLKYKDMEALYFHFQNYKLILKNVRKLTKNPDYIKLRSAIKEDSDTSPVIYIGFNEDKIGRVLLCGRIGLKRDYDKIKQEILKKFSNATNPKFYCFTSEQDVKDQLLSFDYDMTSQDDVNDDDKTCRL